jgi:hypothetical protein
MRPALLCLLSACSSAAVGELPPSSVRERLESPTRLLIAPGRSAGTILAKRWSSTGWQSALVALRVSSGELVATTAPDGAIVVTDFGVAFEPIELPLSTHAELSQVRLDLAASPPEATTTWQGDEAATATTRFALELAWSLEVEGSSVPLGSQPLAPVGVTLDVGRDGASVEAVIAVTGSGPIWTWADLVALAELDLSLAAATP